MCFNMVTEKDLNMSIENSVSITVSTDLDYKYEVNCGDEISLHYKEKEITSDPVYIRFGILNEMEAVAKAMLQAVKVAREMEI